MLPPEAVGNNKNKQELFISDATAVANVTIWQQDINKLKLRASYRFSVHSCRGKKHLSFPPSGASFQEIEDIREVVDESDDLDSNDTSIEGVAVVVIPTGENLYMFQLQKGEHRSRKSAEYMQPLQDGTSPL